MRPMYSCSNARVVLVGGGHAHVQVLRFLEADPLPGASLTLVSNETAGIYSGMVPGFIAGQYRGEETEIDVRPLARLAGAELVLSPVTRIDADRRLITAANGAELSYDVASVNIGSTVAGLDLPGVREHAIPTRPIARLIERIDGLLATARAWPAGQSFRVVVVGGGSAGVEVAFTVLQRLTDAGVPEPRLALVESRAEILTGYPASLVRRVRRRASRLGVELLCERRVAAVKETEVRLEDGSSLPFDALFWVTGAWSHPLFRDSGLPTDERGFVRTQSTLQVEGHDELFAVGDCGTMTEFPDTPKAGVYSVRQGPLVTENLRAFLAGEALRAYRPQGDFLSLLNMGDGTAMGTKWGLSFEGRWVFRLKDRIDREFMGRFQVDS